jgi:hypothetical protein
MLIKLRVSRSEIYFVGNFSPLASLSACFSSFFNLRTAVTIPQRLLSSIRLTPVSISPTTASLPYLCLLILVPPLTLLIIAFYLIGFVTVLDFLT